MALIWQIVFFFSSRRRHTRLQGDWSSDVCSSDLSTAGTRGGARPYRRADSGDSGCLVLLDVGLLAWNVIERNFFLSGTSLRRDRFVTQAFTQLAILGSTGSIGRQCLSVVEALPGRFGVVALAAGSNLDELFGQVERHRPEVVSVGDAAKADEFAARLREKGVSPLPSIHHGRE